jgi:hypothetical protein
MSQATTAIGEFEAALEQAVSEFALDPAERSIRSANVQCAGLSLGMVALHFAYLSPAAQQAKFTLVANSELEVLGNPSATINTYTPEHTMAAYSYDRSSSLIIVNSFSFPDGETRQLRKSDAEALDLSIATRRISNSTVMKRVLLEPGIIRITEDLQKIVADA